MWQVTRKLLEFWMGQDGLQECPRCPGRPLEAEMGIYPLDSLSISVKRNCCPALFPPTWATLSPGWSVGSGLLPPGNFRGAVCGHSQQLCLTHVPGSSSPFYGHLLESYREREWQGCGSAQTVTAPVPTHGHITPYTHPPGQH